MKTWSEIKIPGHLIGLGVGGVLLYVGIHKGGWWHILTVLGAFDALANAGAIMQKIGQPDAPVKV